MFIDEVTIQVLGGKGGNGAVAFYPMKKGPCGGPGGDGGSIFVRGDRQMADLHRYAGAQILKAEDGNPGHSFRKNGRDGQNSVFPVPIGTVLTDTTTGHTIEVDDDQAEYLLARGGRGGRGNSAFVSPTNQVPRQFEPGEPGEERTYHVVLKLIADFGLIGLPNAGKSSLLNELTAAQVKTAMYAFTTLEPNLGVFENKVIADIPGLIEGASTGKGLGFKFLKHVEKVPILLHCLAADSPHITRDYETVMHELESYNKEIVNKKQIILLTKTDLITQTDEKQAMKDLKQFGHEILPVSIYNPDQFQKLQEKLRTIYTL